MKKLLIVSSDQRVGAAMARATEQKLDFEDAKAVSHEQALGEFLTWEPTHVLVFDYSEKNLGSSVHAPWSIGRQTWQDLQGAVTGNECMLRCSFEKYEYSDFIRLPFRLEELQKKFQGEEAT